MFVAYVQDLITRYIFVKLNNYIVKAAVQQIPTKAWSCNIKPLQKTLIVTINMEKYYNEYGKFTINFEEICFRLNYFIRHVCTDGNLFSEEDKRIEILLQGLTAQPILAKFKSLFLTTKHVEDAQLKKMVEIFYSNFITVIECRNLLAHGTFFFGDPHGNTDKFQVRNTKLNKKGFHDNTNIISISSFQNLNSDLLKLLSFIDDLIFYLGTDDKEFSDKLFQKMVTTMLNLKINLEIDGKSVQL